jgi:hypothetical protein
VKCVRVRVRVIDKCLVCMNDADRHHHHHRRRPHVKEKNDGEVPSLTSSC